MGNRIGIDISGTLIRVACVCFPREPDEQQSAVHSSHIWKSAKKEPERQPHSNSCCCSVCEIIDEKRQLNGRERSPVRGLKDSDIVGEIAIPRFYKHAYDER